MKVFTFANPTAAYFGMMKYFMYDNKGGKDNNVIIHIEDGSNNLPFHLPREWDNVYWCLREISDWVAGPIAPGGLSLRYDRVRESIIKNNGLRDWLYAGAAGAQAGSNTPSKDAELLALIAGATQPTFENGDEIQDYYQNLIERLRDNPSETAGRNEGQGQLSWVKEILRKDKDTDKAIICFWDWRRDLVEYYRRKFMYESYTDAIHQRTACGLICRYGVYGRKIHSNFTMRHLVVADHFSVDLWRATETARYLGRYTGHPVGSVTVHAFIARQIYFKSTRPLWRKAIEHYDNHGDFFQYYPMDSMDANPKGVDFWDTQFDLKEKAEQCWRIGAFEDGDKILEELTPYYKMYATAMRVAEMGISLNDLGVSGKYWPLNRNLKKSHDYITTRTNGWLPQNLWLNSMPDTAPKLTVATALMKQYLAQEQNSDATMTLSLLKPEVQQMALVDAIIDSRKKVRDDCRENRLTKEPYKYLDDYHYDFVQSRDLMDD